MTDVLKQYTSEEGYGHVILKRKGEWTLEAVLDEDWFPFTIKQCTDEGEVYNQFSFSAIDDAWTSFHHHAKES